MSKIGHKTLFVGYFPDYIHKTDIETLCKPHGTVLDVTMMRGLNPETKGTSVANYALVEFKSWSQAKSAMKDLSGYVFPFGRPDQCPLYVNFSNQAPHYVPEPCSVTSAKVVSASGQKGSVKGTLEIRQTPSDGPIFKIEEFNSNLSIAIGPAMITEAVAPTTTQFKKMSFLSEYTHEDTQKTIEYQEQTPDLFAPATETLSAVPTDDQPLIDESIPPVKPVEEDNTTSLQTETQDFEDAEETAEDVAIVQASIGALEAMADVEKVELNLASAANEIENVTKKVEVIKSGSIKQDDRMDHVITRISKLEKTLLDLIKKVDM
ncbi:hypothetical protein HDU76_013446, partial [Blyttiomyces sp. JEL0837]